MPRPSPDPAPWPPPPRLAAPSQPPRPLRRRTSSTSASAVAVTSLDPHFYNASPNNSLADAHLRPAGGARRARPASIPASPRAGALVSDTVWEFKLRRGVKWHDGRDFTADDVAFTFERAPNVPNSPGGFGGFVRAIAAGGGGGPADRPLPHPRGRTRCCRPNSPRSASSPAMPARARRRRTTTAAAPRSAPAPTASSPTAPATAPSSPATTPIGAAREPWARVTYRFLAERRRPHRGAAGRRCGPDRPGALQRPRRG